MRFNYFFIFSVLLVLNACGLGEQGVELPENRPNGVIQGKVLGGLYSGGTISVYTLDDVENRQFLASSTVQENGDFIIEFASQTQTVLIEVRGGSYFDISGLQNIKSEPEFIMSTALMYNSGEIHDLPITPITHLTTGLILNLKKESNEKVDEEFLKSAYEKMNALYSIVVNDPTLEISLEENTNELILGGDDKHGLLVSALAEIAYAESLTKDKALKDLYNLSSLNSLMYEDIRSDGILDGKSIYENEAGIKTLAFGNQIIDSNFYRLKIAFAMQKALERTPLVEISDRKEQEEYILSVAQSDSALFSEINSAAFKEIVPEVSLVSSLSDIVKDELVLEFQVKKALKIKSITLKIDELEYPYDPNDIYVPLSGFYSFAFSTARFKDGIHQLSIDVRDTFDNIGSIQIPSTFDNTPPELTITSAHLTNVEEFLLEGTFGDSFSEVKSIIVDGDKAVISDDNRWKKLVTLNDGRNEFLIVIEDELGNSREMLTHITFDKSAPIITITSPGLSNNELFLLAGEFIDEKSNIISITINDEEADIDYTSQKWTKLVELKKSGSNVFLISIEDEAGNHSEFTSYVILDDSAPTIELSSGLVTNSKKFILEGSYQEAYSGVSHISVNGIDATILDDGSWFKPVDLSSGNNDFIIRIEDYAGNQREIISKVILYEDSPVVTLTSKALTNNANYLLEGDYFDGGFGVNYFVVNDEEVNIVALNKWSKTVSLARGLNSFNVEIEDKIGNKTELVIEVILDDLSPVISFISPENVRFSNNDGTYFNNTLSLKNDSPLYIETNKLSLAGMLANKANLDAENIPYIVFNLSDPSLSESKAGVEDLLVEYRYLINDVQKLDWQTELVWRILLGDENSDEFIFPFVSEVYGVPWYKTLPDDLHTLQIKVTDQAGNIALEEMMFKAQFYVPEINITINDEMDSISKGSFDDRASYIDQEVVAVNYTLDNTKNGEIYKIRISDDSSHSLSHEFEEVQRENKLVKHSQEVWRKATIKHLDRNKCPEIDGSPDVVDWPEIKKLWNFVNDRWDEKVPELKVETISLREDTPVPDRPTKWLNYNSADDEVDNIQFNKGTRYSLSYEFDYILDYIEGEEPLPRDNNPGLLKKIVLFIGDVQQPCPTNINAIKTRTEYTYLPLLIDEDNDGEFDVFPRNNLNLKTDGVTFSSSHFGVFNEDGTEIMAESGWFEVPANQTVTIKKYVKTPSLNLYADNTVLDPDSVKDYSPHRLDKKLEWKIDQNLTIDTQFNPDDVLLDDSINIKQQVIQLEDKVDVFQRN